MKHYNYFPLSKRIVHIVRSYQSRPTCHVNHVTNDGLPHPADQYHRHVGYFFG